MTQMIYDYHDPGVREMWENAGPERWSGAYYYNQEIIKYFIPTVKTDRNWILYNRPGFGWDHSIVFVHNNIWPHMYEWLSKLNDIILICGVPQSVEKMSYIADTAYLPISVDVEYVEQFKVAEKTEDTCYYGRERKIVDAGIDFSEDVTIVSGQPREICLPEVAKYEKCFAVGRAAIEAKILGCEVLPFDDRYPDPSIWEIRDSRDAAKELQAILDEFEER